MSVHTVTVHCPRCGENMVDVALGRGYEVDDYDAIRCGYCGELSDEDREKCIEEAVYNAHEYARRRHDY